MKIEMIGRKAYKFTEDGTNRTVEGVSVWYTASTQGVTGKSADKLSIKADNALYHKVMALDFSKPIPASADFEVAPGSKKAILTDLQF